MTRTSIIVAADDRLSDWVRVLNAGREHRYGYSPLSVRDVKRIASAGLISIDRLFLALEGPIPAAVARVEISGKPEAAICDLSLMPGHRSAGSTLVDYLLAACREARVQTVTAWISDTEARFSDILASYTFEPRKIRSLLEVRLEGRSDLVDVDSSCMVDVTKLPQTGDEQLLRPPPWRVTRDLEGLRDDMENRWRTVAVVKLERSQPIAIARLSQSDQTKALLSVDEDFVRQGEPTPFSERLVRSVLNGLYKRGVREVLCETESDSKVRGPLLEAGFVQQSTIFQFSLRLMYDEGFDIRQQ